MMLRLIWVGVVTKKLKQDWSCRMMWPTSNSLASEKLSDATHTNLVRCQICPLPLISVLKKVKVMALRSFEESESGFGGGFEKLAWRPWAFYAPTHSMSPPGEALPPNMTIWWYNDKIIWECEDVMMNLCWHLCDRQAGLFLMMHRMVTLIWLPSSILTKCWYASNTPLSIAFHMIDNVTRPKNMTLT